MCVWGGGGGFARTFGSSEYTIIFCIRRTAAAYVSENCYAKIDNYDNNLNNNNTIIIIITRVEVEGGGGRGRRTVGREGEEEEEK